MGIVNVFKGLESERTIYNFNGRLRKHLDLDWKHCKMLLGDKEITKNYAVKEDDVVYVREYPGATALAIASIVVAVISVGVGVWAGVTARNAAREAERQMEDALRRLRNDNRRRDVESIPHLSGARNEFAEGRQAPIILGRHLFAPYFLSEPYMRPDGRDGEDLYWYGTFLVGQTGLNLEKIRNGTIDLVSLDGGAETQSRAYRFDRPPNLDPASPPPFYDPENKIEVRQKGYFEEGVFNDRWVDSLEASVEIGRKRKDEAGTIDDVFVDDDGPDPVIRESAKFPMRVEVEIRVDGLHGWNSNNGTPTPATVELRVEWSRDGVGGWQPIPIAGGAGHQLGEWRPVNADDGPGFGLTRNSMRQMRFIAAVDLPASAYSDDGAPVHIRTTRLTMQHTGGYRSRTVLTAIRTRQYSPRRTREAMATDNPRLIPAKNIVPSLADKLCRVGIKIKVNENTQEHMDRFNAIASMTGRTWDGGRWSLEKTATSNPAAVALELMTGLIHEPSRHGDSELDLESLGGLHEWCDSREVTVAGSGLRPVRLEACGVLTGATRKLDALQRTLAACDAGMYAGEFGKLRFWYDDRKDTPAALLNPQRIVRDSMSESRDLSRRLDGYMVRFVDRDGDWSERTERALRPRVERVEGRNEFKPFSPEYVTDYYHAMWLARRTMAREILQPGEITVEVGREGRHYAPGTLLKVSHKGFRIGIGDGEIVENIVENGEVVGIRTMERHDLREDRDYWVDFYVVDGNRNHVVTKRIQSVGEYTDRLMFTSPITHSHDKPALGNIVSVIDGLREGHARVLESKRCVVMDASPTGKGHRLTLARYDDRIYGTGAIDAIPEYESRILPTAPRVYRTPPMAPYVPSPAAPRVGPNGNWWIGATDTGIPAKGEDGRSLNFRGKWSPTPFEVDDVFTFQGRSFITITRITHAGSTPPWPLTNPTAAQRFALLADKGADGADGKDGVGISSVAYAFLRNDSGAPPAETAAGWAEWDAAIHVPNSADRFLWYRETTVFTDGASSVRVGLESVHGEAGGAGRGIASIAYRWRTTASAAQPPETPDGANPANSWVTAQPATDATNRWLWFRQATAFTDGTGQVIVGLQAVHGQTGAPGPAGNYTEFRFRTNDADVANPGNPAFADRNPANWSTAMTAPASAGGSVWMIQAAIGADDALVGTWTMPSMLSSRGTNGTNGATGRGIASIEIRFQRANTATPPAYPPAGQWGSWLADAPALDSAFRWLWKLERVAFDSGTPATQDFRTLIAQRGEDGRDGEDGLGIDAIPIDAYAYWSCDDLPEIPDNPAGIHFRQDSFDSLAGWNVNVGGASISGEVIRVSGDTGAGVWRNVPANIPIAALRVRVIAGEVLFGWEILFTERRGVGNHAVILARPNLTAFSNFVIYSGQPGSVFEIQAVYFGDGSYISPLLDSAGSNHATMPASGGVIPTQGRHGKGLDFLGGGLVITPISADFFQRDFAISMWINVREAHSHTSHVIGAGGFQIALLNQAPNVYQVAVLVGGSQFAFSSIGRNQWTHIVLMREGNNMSFSMNNGPSVIFPALAVAGSGQICIGGIQGPPPSQRFHGLGDEFMFFTRALTDEERKALYKTSLSVLPQYQPPRWDERYRGSTAIADVNNTGRINGEVMHRGNFVMFTGVTVGIWQTARLMQWDGRVWRRLPVETNRDKYMLALNDLTAGAPDGIFSTAFIRTLFLDMGTANTFNILCTLVVGSLANGIRINGPGRSIESSDFAANSAGFRITDGHIEANSINVNRGRIQNADIDNVTIGDGAVFNGRIRSGNFVVEYGTFRRFPASGVFAQGTNTMTIVNQLAGLGFPPPSTSGVVVPVEAGMAGTIPIRSITYWFASNAPIIMQAARADGTGSPVWITSAGVSPNTLVSLWFQIGVGVKTARFLNLPTSPGLESGTIWRDSNGFLRVV